MPLNQNRTVEIGVPLTPNYGNSQVHPIICTRTGITVAALTVHKIAGHVPYLSQWKHTQALHPLFSLEPTALLNFSKSLWNYFCSLTPEEAANEQLTSKQEMLLRVAALALVHNLADVDQTTVWVPTLSEVTSNWTSLLQLSYWKNYLESKRFKFPALRISKFNKGVDLQAFIHDCWIVKKEYETKVREAVELEKLQSAEMALKVLRDDLAGKAPRSKKMLWRWFIANIPSRYAKDTDGWMWELFDAETDQEISEFTMADIDLFEEICLCEIPTGSTISHTFLERISHKRKMLENKFHTYEILVPELVALGVADGSISSVEPKLSDYPKRVQFIIAHAKWKLGHTDQTAHRTAAVALQSTVTVKPTFVPNIDDYLNRSEEVEEDDLGPLYDRSKVDDIITGELED